MLTDNVFQDAVTQYTLQMYISVSPWLPLDINACEVSEDLQFATKVFDSLGTWEPWSPLSEVDTPCLQVARVAISPDGHWLAASDDKRVWVRIVNLGDVTIPAFAHAIEGTSSTDRGLSVVWSPCSTSVAVMPQWRNEGYVPVTILSLRDAQTCAWSATTYRCLGLPVADGVAYSLDGTSLLVCTQCDDSIDWRLLVIDRYSNTRTPTLLVANSPAPASARVLDMMWPSNSIVLLACSEVSPRTQDCVVLSRLQIKFTSRSLKATRSTPYLAVQAKFKLPLLDNQYVSAFSLDGTKFIVCHGTSRLHIYDTHSGEHLRDISCHSAGVYFSLKSLKQMSTIPILSPDMKYLYLGIHGVYDLQSFSRPTRVLSHSAEEALETLAATNPTRSSRHRCNVMNSIGSQWIHDYYHRQILSVHGEGDIEGIHGDRLVILHFGRLLILRLHPHLLRNNHRSLPS